MYTLATIVMTNIILLVLGMYIGWRLTMRYMQEQRSRNADEWTEILDLLTYAVSEYAIKNNLSELDQDHWAVKSIHRLK